MVKHFSKEKCCCCLGVHAATCAIAVIQLLSTLIWSGLCFQILYLSQRYVNLPHNINEFVYEEYGQTLGKHYFMWGSLIALFVSAFFVIVGHAKQNGRWYWPSLIVNTILIARYTEQEVLYLINNHQPSTYFFLYFVFIVVDTYFTIMVYKGKSYLDYLQLELAQAKQMDDLIVAIHEADGQHLTRQEHATAPPMSVNENEYYYLR